MLLMAIAAGILIAQSSDRVMVIDNVNVRAAPGTEAPVVCRESMGTELQVQARENGWVRVSSCGRDAFISERLIRDVTPENRAAVREGLLRERLARPGQDLREADRVLSLVTHWAGASDVTRDREAEARYALYELQALARAADASLRSGAFSGRFAGRLGEHSPVFFYNEVGGGWMIRNSYIWAVHDRFQDARAADDIAWFAAEHGLGGECEGDLPCMLSRLDALAGAYLRRHPAGRFVDRALARIEEWLDFGGQPPKRSDYDLVPNGTTCRDLQKPLAALRAAVALTTSPHKSKALAPLVQIEAACR